MNTPEFRAFWVDAYHPGIKSPQEVERLVRDLRAANINAILVQVRRRADAYFNMSIEPRSHELSRRPNFDPLAYLLELAHLSDPPIEVHAWLAALPVASAIAPPTDPEHLYHRHGPWATGDDMWLTVADDGSITAEGTYSLDPGHPAAAQHLVDVVTDLARNYEIDGIHLDRFRYPERQFGYNAVSLARYQASYATTAIPAPADPSWQQWRRAQLTHLMRQIYLEAIAIRPEVKISASAVCWGAAPISDDGWRRSAALATTYQDWLSWLREGIIDMIVPMNYNRESDARQRAWFDQWLAWEIQHCTDRHLVVGLGAFLNRIDDTLAQARRARQPLPNGAHAQGLSFYSYASTHANRQPDDALFLALAMGNAFADEPLFGEPTSTPDMPWKSLPRTGYLKGVVCLADGRPGEGFSVTLEGPAQRVLDVSGTGFFGAAGLPTGLYTASLNRNGRVVNSVEVLVQSGRVTTADLELESPVIEVA